ncbi:hypothetical protein C8R43DRAFT_954080 [Mycena crocata]|nr:hypothetical protein C8R43DRAFT_954077 [Mycena crocata]KAJ7143285.1 hypothetical protein C8R43DRAFT_954080 [Mycena crocata]
MQNTSMHETFWFIHPTKRTQLFLPILANTPHHVQFLFIWAFTLLAVPVVLLVGAPANLHRWIMIMPAVPDLIPVSLSAAHGKNIRTKVQYQGKDQHVRVPGS